VRNVCVCALTPLLLPGCCVQPLSLSPITMRSVRVAGLLVLALVLLLAVSVSADAAAQREKIAKYNARVGAKFLSEKAAEEGVTKLDSGVLYKVLTASPNPATAKTPGATDQVKVHYAGTLINGQEFDSSYSRGQPAEFGVNGVIRGWTEVLQLMKEGDVWEVYIPSDKAYGAAGSGAKIGPNSTLVFKIELLEVKGKGAKARPAPPKKTKKPAVDKAEL